MSNERGRGAGRGLPEAKRADGMRKAINDMIGADNKCATLETGPAYRL